MNNGISGPKMKATLNVFFGRGISRRNGRPPWGAVSGLGSAPRTSPLAVAPSPRSPKSSTVVTNSCRYCTRISDLEGLEVVANYSKFFFEFDDLAKIKHVLCWHGWHKQKQRWQKNKIWQNLQHTDDGVHKRNLTNICPQLSHGGRVHQTDPVGEDKQWSSRECVRIQSGKVKWNVGEFDQMRMWMILTSMRVQPQRTTKYKINAKWHDHIRSSLHAVQLILQ